MFRNLQLFKLLMKRPVNVSLKQKVDIYLEIRKHEKSITFSPTQKLVTNTTDSNPKLMNNVSIDDNVWQRSEGLSPSGKIISILTEATKEAVKNASAIVIPGLGVDSAAAMSGFLKHLRAAKFLPPINSEEASEIQLVGVASVISKAKRYEGLVKYNLDPYYVEPSLKKVTEQLLVSRFINEDGELLPKIASTSLVSFSIGARDSLMSIVHLKELLSKKIGEKTLGLLNERILDLVINNEKTSDLVINNALSILGIGCALDLPHIYASNINKLLVFAGSHDIGVLRCSFIHNLTTDPLILNNQFLVIDLGGNAVNYLLLLGYYPEISKKYDDKNHDLRFYNEVIHKLPEDLQKDIAHFFFRKNPIDSNNMMEPQQSRDHFKLEHPALAKYAIPLEQVTGSLEGRITVIDRLFGLTPIIESDLAPIIGSEWGYDRY